MKMKEAREEAKEFIKETTDIVCDAEYDADALAELILWAYDKGWSEGIEDYREEKDFNNRQQYRKIQQAPKVGKISVDKIQRAVESVSKTNKN